MPKLYCGADCTAGIGCYLCNAVSAGARFPELPSLRLEHCCASRFNLAFAAPSLKSDLKLSNSAYGLGAGKHSLAAT